MPAVNRTATGVGSDSCPKCTVGNAEADFFPLHVSARLRQRSLLISPCQQGVAAGLSPVCECHTGQEQDCHHCEYRPAMALRPRHAAQCVRESATQAEDRDQLNEIGQRRWIFKWVSAVGIEKSAAISPQLFNNFLRCDRALSDGLVATPAIF